MLKITDLVHLMIKEYLKPDMTVIDATAGNGHDTYNLAQLLNNTGTIHAYDIQAKAIEQTKLKTKDFTNIIYHHQSHLEITTHFDLCLFNLGYLPNGDKTITTDPLITLKTIEKLLTLNNPKFMILIVCYPGHSQGAIESNLLVEYVKKLDANLYLGSIYQNINQHNAPFIIRITNKR